MSTLCHSSSSFFILQSTFILDQKNSFFLHSTTILQGTINQSRLPRHLIIRANVHNCVQFSNRCFSTLAAAIDVLKSTTSLHHLTFEIVLDPIKESFFQSDFARFVTLLESSLTVQIDLYVYWHGLEEVVILIEEYRTLVGLAEKGVLVLHAQETAPADLTALGDCPIDFRCT